VLLIANNEELTSRGLEQNEAAELPHITRPRVNTLKQEKISDIRLDSLVDIAHRLGLHASIEIAT
jgi:predicted XRE-type DNA-binding protein